MTLTKAESAKEADERRERREQVAKLRISGKTTRDIAAAVGTSHVTVVNDLKVIRAEWAESMTQSYDQHVALEAARYDRVLVALWPAVERGEIEAVNAFIRLADRRARLLGLDHSDKINEARMVIEAHQAQIMTGILMAAMTNAGLNPTQQAAMVESVQTQILTVVGELA